MDFLQDLLPGVRLLSLNRLVDFRGSFVKTFSHSRFKDEGLSFDCKEEFYSLSKKNVIRGMHFQLPPHDHDKIVHCATGMVLDVLLDLRCGTGQGKVTSIVLDAAKPHLLFIPRGVAHGFKALVDDSLMIYKTSSEHVPTHDAGVHWNSFGFDWGAVGEDPIVSLRDAAHPHLEAFESPF